MATEQPAPRLVELPPDDDEVTELRGMPSRVSRQPIPALYTSRPFFHDELETATSALQDETIDECLPWLTGEDEYTDDDLNSFGIPKLRRAKHIRFLHNALRLLPEGFVALDASRPWLVYWSLNSLSMLGVDLDAKGVFDYKSRAIATLASCQSPHGGFGGSSHQLPHLACSYAAVLTVCLLGGANAYDMIDRRAMWHFLCRMKQPDGGFTMCAGGEEDVRGAFCAVVIASLLDLPLGLAPSEAARLNPRRRGGAAPTDHDDNDDDDEDETALLTDGLAAWVSRCQTFEGGIGAAPGSEAHGAYTFCGLAALCVLGAPRDAVPAHLDARALLAWLAARQLAPEGGFAGRTNKLVDGCYSHWAGGCWALLEAALSPAALSAAAVDDEEQQQQQQECRLWDREGLARYILCCAQNPPGGLRDKPGKGPDAYHTNYNLAGLSWAQARYAWGDGPAQGGDEGAREPPPPHALDAAFKWRLAGRDDAVPCDGDDLVTPVHPVFVVRHDKADEMRRYFLAKAGF